jgi:hypothetical protein
MDSLLEMTQAAAVKSMVDSIAWLYVVTNSVRVFFYAPQIRAVLKADDGAVAVSITTWGFWTFANLTATLYGVLVIQDNAFSAIFGCNLVCTAAVTLIASAKRCNKRLCRDTTTLGTVSTR